MVGCVGVCVGGGGGRGEAQFLVSYILCIDIEGDTVNTALYEK